MSLMMTQAKAVSETPRFLTVHAAATYLSLSRRALYHRVERRSIPFLKRGRRLWFDRTVLDRWMAAGAVDVFPSHVIDSKTSRKSAPER
jgi:excisionase family DNA binding protein